jgi:predicted alpha/beta-fold hydrolase
MQAVAVVLIGLVVLLIALVMYRCDVSYLPKVTLNREGAVAGIVSQVKFLSQRYQPVPWIVGGHLSSIWGLRFRPIASNKYNREEFKFADGGTTVLDWFEPADAPPETPVVVIIHTLGGGTREPCTNNMAVAVQKHGWRACVANCRACSGAPITSKRLFNAYEIDDMQAIVHHIQHEKYKPRFTFMVGFSLGSMQATRYAINEDNIDAFGLVSDCYDPMGSSALLETPLAKKLYLSVIVSKMVRAVVKNKYITDEKLRSSIHSKTLREFDDLFTSQTLGFKDHVEYYEKLAIKDKMDIVKAPMLILGADDDPFTLPRYQPLKEVAASRKVVMVTYPEGGHVNFATGTNGRKAVTEGLMLEWFEAVKRSKET